MQVTAAELVTTLTTAGCRLIPDGERLRVQDPQQALTDDLRQAIRQHKEALLVLVREPFGRMGRHGAPCPQCHDTWQWPTITWDWICAECFVVDPQTAPRFADDGSVLHAPATGLQNPAKPAQE